MEVHFSPELQARVEAAAAEVNTAADPYVQSLVANYIEHDAWFRRKVTASLERLDRGQFLTEEQVGARIEELLRTK